jgi:hypothetical protein
MSARAPSSAAKTTRFKGRGRAVYNPAPVATPAPQALPAAMPAALAAVVNRPPRTTPPTAPAACTLREPEATGSSERDLDMVRKDNRDGVISLVRDPLNLRYLVTRSEAGNYRDVVVIHLEPGLRDSHRRRAQKFMSDVIHRINSDPRYEPPIRDVRR